MLTFTFAIVFEGGFALVATCREAQFIVRQESGVLIKGLPSRQEAYVQACTEYVDRALKKNPYWQPMLPRLEDLEQVSIFHAPGFVTHYTANRVFAAINPRFMGIMTDSEKAIGFLENCTEDTVVLEVSSVLEGQNLINYHYLKAILPMEAYITEEIPYVNNIPLDVIIPVPYFTWMKQHCIVPKQLPFTGYLPTKELKQIVERVPKS